MTILIAAYLFVLGLVCGSFFNVVGLRVPVKQSIVHPPSQCTSCGTKLSPRDLIPVLSYLFARGKCRHCSARVSVVYPLGELVTGLLFVWSYLTFGLTSQGWIALLLVSMSVILTVSDLKYMLLPNRILLAFTPVFVLARIFFPGEQPLWHYVIGAIIGGGIIVLVIVLSRGGMGMGDAKLFALCGWTVGFPHTLIALLLACFIGTLVGGTLLLLKIINRKQPIPFGPFLALGTLISYAYGTQLIDSYLSIFT